MIHFDNTEIAFKNLSNKQLKRAYWLFKLIGYSWVIKYGLPLLRIAIKLRLPVLWAVKRTVFHHFCGGVDIDTCSHTIHELGKHNVKAILDYSVEGKERTEDFERCTSEVIQTIQRAKNDELIPFSVFKMTGVAPVHILEKANKENIPTATDQAEFEQVKDRVDRICKSAYDLGQPLFIDAEETWIQDAIDQIVLDMMRKYNKEDFIIYNTVQMYRWDRLDYIKSLHEIAKKEGFKIGLKIVRGAYMEKERERATEKGYPSPIQKDKTAADRDFNDALRYCTQHINDIAFCCGSHNEASSLLLTELIDQYKLDKADPRVYFAQLLGMSDHISYNLSEKGYNVVKYVPYGPVRDVIPYLLRRAEENSSVEGQQGREMMLLTKEMKRRGLK